MKITRVVQKNGRHYYIQDLEARNPVTGRPRQRWHKLTRADQGEPALLEALRQLLGQAEEAVGNMPALIKDFQTVTFIDITAGVKAEYERMCGKIAIAFKKFDADEVEPGDIEQFLNENFQGRQNSKIKFKAMLSSFFAWCTRNSRTKVKFNPCREITLSAPVKRKGKMSAEVYWKLHDALPPMGQCFLDLLYFSKQRPTEIRLLRESQISNGRIDFEPTKTRDSSGAHASMVITPEMQRALDRARDLRRARNAKRKVTAIRDEFIIQNRTGDGYHTDGLYSMLRAAVKRAGIKGVNWRHLRPFALSTMEKAGYSLRQIQDAGMHKSITTTEVYLDQHRERVLDAPIPLPERPKT